LVFLRRRELDRTLMARVGVGDPFAESEGCIGGGLHQSEVLPELFVWEVLLYLWFGQHNDNHIITIRGTNLSYAAVV
jgi:hypothetical protein